MPRKKNVPELEHLTGPEPSPDELPNELSDAVGYESVDGRVRKPKTVDAATSALFPNGVADLPERIHAAVRAWREANDREVPSIDRLQGTVVRVDVDPASGYLAVVTKDDTWRAFLPREQLVTVVTLLVRRPVDEVTNAMSAGPTAITVSSPRSFDRP